MHRSGARRLLAVLALTLALPTALALSLGSTTSPASPPPRYSYPADCCRYRLSGGFRSEPLPRGDLGEPERELEENKLVEKDTGREAACSGNTISVWSTAARNFTRRVDPSTGYELTTPVYVRGGSRLVVHPVDDATFAELDGRLVRLDLDCTPDGALFAAGQPGEDCALVWLGGELDPRVQQLPPCLGMGGPGSLPPAGLVPQTGESDSSAVADDNDPAMSTPPVDHSTSLEPPAGVQLPNDDVTITLSPDGEASAAVRHVDVTPLSFVIGMLVVCALLQLVLLIDGIEHLSF